jgi:hypothetical protein
MSDNYILRSKMPPLDIPLKSVGEILWQKLRELNEEANCIVSKVKKLSKMLFENSSHFFCFKIRSKQKVVTSYQ